jgi:peptidoglycan/xylan/chitin deacetylase (PgdA/CDA1 family)
MTSRRDRDSPARVAAFGYHEVSDEPLSSGLTRPGALQFTVSRGAFAAHLDRFAAAQRPSLVTDVDLTRPGRHLLLTFDDGGKSALYAGEALRARGWRGHFFIITSRLGGRTFLSGAEARELHSLGHLVGSHSHTHPDIFREQSLAEMVEQWRVSTDHLAQLLGHSVRVGAVPGGHISPDVLRSADIAGLTHLLTCDPTPVPRLEGACWVLGRFLVKRGTPATTIGALASFQRWRRSLLVRRAKDAVRRAAPHMFRLYLRRRTRESPAVG